jgi:hypothetical protein
MQNGTDKQIAWADEIRNSWIARCQDTEERVLKPFIFKAQMKFDLAPGEQTRAFRAALLPLVSEWAAAKTDATWWINNREDLKEIMVSELMEMAMELAREIAATTEEVAR